MFENPRTGRPARNFTTNVTKILGLKSSCEQIFSENCRWVPLRVELCNEIAEQAWKCEPLWRFYPLNLDVTNRSTISKLLTTLLTQQRGATVYPGKTISALLRAQISTKCMHSSSLCRIMFLRQCNDLAGLARRDNFLLTVHSCININSHSDQSFKSLLPHPFTLDGDLPHLPSSQLLGLTLSCLPTLDAKPPMPFLKPASPKASGQIQNLFML